MFGLSPIDLTMLVLYLVGITGLGLWMGHKIHSQADYFVGGRRFGKVLAIFTSFGAGTHSDQAVSVVSKTCASGMSGIWYQWCYLFATPFYWWINPIFRRCRALTTGDYFEARYSRGLATLYVVVGFASMAVTIGLMLKGSGAIIAATTGSAVSENQAILFVTFMLILYGVFGGFSAAVVTDFVQGCLTIVFSFLLLPFAIYKLGGFEGLHAAVAKATGERAAEMWSLVAPGEIGLFYIVMLVINGLVGFAPQPHVMPINNAVKTEREAQVGGVYGGFMKRVCTVAWTMLGMCAIAMYPTWSKPEEFDQAFGTMARDLLPQVMPGLIGIFLASLLAAVMAACDAFMITCAGLFTQNIYKPYLARGRSSAHYINVGRVTAAITVGVGVYLAMSFPSVVRGLEIFWEITPMMGIAFWLGLFWRRATTPAAWASTLLAYGVLYVSWQPWFAEWAAEHAKFLMNPAKPDTIYLPMRMLACLLTGTVVMVVVSLVTRPEDKEKLDRFYEVMRTPVQPGEVIEAPMTLPVGTLPAPQNKLINLPNWEIQKPTRRGIIGFFVAWIPVAALIGIVVVLVRIGA
ncbi:MAG TPA: sodium:solute symporter family protein [Phycisphaerae bacterium]|nr:sodium:solute symporter family protein [Phycisphaerae bacterium]HOQ87350.1 sodium:solute symporter family protein [Phycisphaerae bacterium]HQE27551.1 sodium:solute symporter family protein [Phycisphaerae bacterium]